MSGHIIYTLLSLRELLLLSRLERIFSLPRAFGLVGEVEQAVSTGLEAGKDSLITSIERLLSADDRSTTLLTNWPPSGGSLGKDERCLTDVLSGDSRDATSNTLSGDCMLSLGKTALTVILDDLISLAFAMLCTDLSAPEWKKSGDQLGLFFEISSPSAAEGTV